MATREEIDAEKTKMMQMPDEELQKLVPSRDAIDAEKQSLANLSDNELNKMAFGIEPEKSFLERAGGAIIKAGEAVDSYTGAPTRAAFSELIRTNPEFGKEPPSVIGNIKSAGEAFVNQFSASPGLAPTGKDIAQKRMGLDGDSKPYVHKMMPTSEIDRKSLIMQGYQPDEKGIYSKTFDTASPAGAVGVVLDIGLDPLNVVPVGTIAKGAKEAVKGTTGLALRGSYNFAKAVAPTATGLTEGVAKGLGKSVDRFINPKIAADFGELKKIAAKNNITDIGSDAVEFGQDSFVDLLSRARMQSGAADTALEKFRSGLSQIRDGIDTKIKTISGTDRVMDKAQAGEFLANALQDAKTRVLGESENTYALIGKNNPGMKLSGDAENKIIKGLSEVETLANRLSKGTMAQRGQAAVLKDNMQAILNSSNNYDEMVSALQNLGREAYPQTAKTLMERDPEDLKALRKLYTTVKDSLVETVGQNVGKDVAKNLVDNNKVMSKFFDDASIFGSDISKLESGKIGPEQLFSKYIERGNTSGIAALKDILTPDQFNQLKGAYLDGFITRKLDSGEGFNFVGLRSALTNSDNKLRTSAILEPEEFKDMADLLLLGDRYGSAILNTSGTFRSKQVLQGIKDAVGDAVSNEALLKWLKTRARNKTKEVATSNAPLFGPRAIGAKEAIGLRLPQQISIKQKEEQ